MRMPCRPGRLTHWRDRGMESETMKRRPMGLGVEDSALRPRTAATAGCPCHDNRSRAQCPSSTAVRGSHQRHSYIEGLLVRLAYRFRYWAWGRRASGTGADRGAWTLAEPRDSGCQHRHGLLLPGGIDSFVVAEGVVTRRRLIIETLLTGGIATSSTTCSRACLVGRCASGAVS